MKKSTICIAEDREKCEPALKLLLLSLNAHCPEIAINLFYPAGKGGFITWVKKYPQVCLRADRLKNGLGWNVKPHAIMKLLDEGFDEVIWIDSDIIVTRSIVPIFSGLTKDTFVASEHTLSEERDDRNALRARLWGFPVGRSLTFAVSSGVLRVTGDHYQLMDRWWNLLQSKTYQEFQRIGWRKSPVHMKGDQDVVTALLTSTEFSHIPIRLLRRGKHIVLFDGVFGYTVPERIRNLMHDGPTFIHIAGAKPWSEQWHLDPSNRLREYVKKVYLDLAPYTLTARQFKRDLDCDTGWMEAHYNLSRLLRLLGMGHPPLVGLPMAMFADLTRVARHMRKFRHPNPAFFNVAGPRVASKRVP